MLPLVQHFLHILEQLKVHDSIICDTQHYHVHYLHHIVYCLITFERCCQGFNVDRIEYKYGWEIHFFKKLI